MELKRKACMNPNQKRTLRNLIIFTFCIIAIPWLGVGLDFGRGADPHEQNNSLGWLLFILTPLVVSLLLRIFAGDGWRDFGLNPTLKGNRKWYLFALLFHPVSLAVILLLGAACGATLIPDLSTAKFALIGQTLLAFFIPSFLKNIFEEFAWRGYLAPKMGLVVKNPLVGHLLVGIIWLCWHLPYYLVLLPPATLQNATSLSFGVFMLMGLFGILPTAIIYGELRARTNSVWPAVLIHILANISFDALVAQKFFSFPNLTAELIFSPALFGIVVIALNLAVGLWLYRTRSIGEVQHA
jgi:membrane protease YdiL (CAAX protease family)